jgi:hypothetical protein
MAYSQHTINVNWKMKHQIASNGFSRETHLPPSQTPLAFVDGAGEVVQVEGTNYLRVNDLEMTGCTIMD